MFPFQPKRSLFANPDENIGLSPDDLFAMHVQQMYDPSQQDVDLPVYQPEHAMLDQFSQSLQGMPQREKPGFGRRLLGAIGGLGIDNPIASMKVTDEITNKPYYQKLEDWKLRTGTLEKGAELENRRNINKRLFAGTEERTRHAIETEKAKSRELEISKEKSDRIYETKLADLERKANEAQNKLELAEKTLSSRNTNAESDRELRKAQLDAMNARHQLDLAQKQRQLEETKSLHEIMKRKWEEENKDRDVRLGQYEKQLGINQQRADQAPGSDKTVTTEKKDAKGVIQETRTTTTKAGSGPKIGNIKTFPNGNKGKWDGKGWVAVQ